MLMPLGYQIEPMRVAARRGCGFPLTLMPPGYQIEPMSDAARRWEDHPLVLMLPSIKSRRYGSRHDLERVSRSF
jgi:hypothetical protein